MLESGTPPAAGGALRHRDVVSRRIVEKATDRLRKRDVVARGHKQRFLLVFDASRGCRRLGSPRSPSLQPSIRALRVASPRNGTRRRERPSRQLDPAPRRSAGARGRESAPRAPRRAARDGRVRARPRRRRSAGSAGGVRACRAPVAPSRAPFPAGGRTQSRPRRPPARARVRVWHAPCRRPAYPGIPLGMKTTLLAGILSSSIIRIRSVGETATIAPARRAISSRSTTRRSMPS